jgi:hypothetical protein
LVAIGASYAIHPTSGKGSSANYFALTAFSEVRSLRFVWFLEAAEILQLLDAFRPDQDVGVGGEGVRPLDGEAGLKVLVATGSRSPVLQQQ